MGKLYKQLEMPEIFGFIGKNGFQKGAISFIIRALKI